MSLAAKRASGAGRVTGLSGGEAAVQGAGVIGDVDVKNPRHSALFDSPCKLR